MGQHAQLEDTGKNSFSVGTENAHRKFIKSQNKDRDIVTMEG